MLMCNTEAGIDAELLCLKQLNDLFASCGGMLRPRYSSSWYRVAVKRVSLRVSHRCA